MHKVEIRGRNPSGLPLGVAVDSEGKTIQAPASTIGGGRQTASPVNYPTQLYSTPTVCKWIQIQAEVDNDGYIVVGATPTVATSPSNVGYTLAKSESIQVDGDLSDFYIVATTPGEGVGYIYGV